ncbi:enoyl-CoA hydratase-related protein [Roseomonas sp. NAR14]|uniref:Enoyl-CoA hydratase-related protein n=1 Tax=Roseomonas acroporae TaxID=2937791 RepID=A0A9X1YE70_9PROT|nr:enoyl-CoA hydratase-related protein [Roseomonas acroporae]MCK8784756.1 enoyl-CoA hydratase-related protein [Roseomonas acroporae]
MTETPDGTPPSGPVLLGLPEPHVALVTLNRPEARNAVNGALAAALGAIVERVEADPEIRVAILTGAGPHAFCAGADLKEVAAGRVHTLHTETGGFAGFVRAPRAKPWIAAAQGHALAGGLELLLACDMAVAADSATFGLPEVKRSLVAAAGGVFRLPRALPRAVALRMIATGEPLAAAEAERHGLLNRVVPAGEVLAAALDLARRIVANAPIAVRESLAIARRAGELDDETLWRLSREASARIRETEDFREGPRAFVEKRAPRWVGR